MAETGQVKKQETHGDPMDRNSSGGKKKNSSLLGEAGRGKSSNVLALKGKEKLRLTCARESNS